MRVRLFKLSQRARSLALSLGTLHCLALLGACAGKEFSAGGSQTGGASGSIGAGAGGETVSEAGEAGSVEGGSGGAPIAGAGGETSSAGSAGKPATGCDCAAGEYCQDGTTRCQKCADFSRLEFGTAQALNTLAQSPNSVERFARSAGAGSALFYVSGASDKARVMYTAAPVSGVGAPVSLTMQNESGPLFVSADFLPQSQEQNFFFDRRDGERKLMMAEWNAPLLTKEALLPEPLNAPGFDDYSIAISPTTGHVYWMSTRNGSPELFWQATSMSAPPAPAVLELKLKVGKTAECPRSGEDATPWVNAAGSLLLFSNPSVNEDCQESDSGATDLFAAPLDKDGKPLAAATPLTSLNTTGGVSRQTDPSLSPDSCFVYFASDNGTGDFNLYKAQRK
jgi:hypothetical protein